MFEPPEPGPPDQTSVDRHRLLLILGCKVIGAEVLPHLAEHLGRVPLRVKNVADPTRVNLSGTDRDFLVHFGHRRQVQVVPAAPLQTAAYRKIGPPLHSRTSGLGLS